MTNNITLCVTTVAHLPPPHPILNVLLCHTPPHPFFFFYFAVNHRVTVGGRFGVITDDDLGLTVLILVSIICFLFGLF